MKTLTWRASEPPLRNFCPASSWLSVKRTPGARAARPRKLRLFCGSASICCGVTLVAISEVRGLEQELHGVADHGHVLA